MEVIVWFVVISLIVVSSIYGKQGAGNRNRKNRSDKNLMNQTKKNLTEQAKRTAGEFVSQKEIQMQMDGRKRRMQQHTARPAGSAEKKHVLQQHSSGGRKQDILARAAANAEEDFGQNTYADEKEHMRHMTADLPDDCDLMRKVQDLIVMGYQGNLQFERDFIGEAEDTINSFMKF